MQAAAWTMRRPPGRRSSRSDIISARRCERPAGRRLGRAVCDCSSRKERISCSTKSGTPSAASIAWAIVFSGSLATPGSDIASSRHSAGASCSRRIVSSTGGTVGAFGNDRAVRMTRTGWSVSPSTISMSSSAEDGSSRCTSSTQKIVGARLAVIAIVLQMKSYCLRLNNCGVWS